MLAFPQSQWDVVKRALTSLGLVTNKGLCMSTQPLGLDVKVLVFQSWVAVLCGKVKRFTGLVNQYMQDRIYTLYLNTLFA
jgi:hypothetical protein